MLVGCVERCGQHRQEEVEVAGCVARFANACVKREWHPAFSKLDDESFHNGDRECTPFNKTTETFSLFSSGLAGDDVSNLERHFPPSLGSDANSPRVWLTRHEWSKVVEDVVIAIERECMLVENGLVVADWLLSTFTHVVETCEYISSLLCCCCQRVQKESVIDTSVGSDIEVGESVDFFNL